MSTHLHNAVDNNHVSQSRPSACSRFWAVPELRHLVFCFLGEREVAPLLRVSKDFFEVGVRTVWRSVSFGNYETIRKSTRSFHRLDAYCQSVKYLAYDRQAQKSEPSLASFLLNYLRIFPKLESVDYLRADTLDCRRMREKVPQLIIERNLPFIVSLISGIPEFRRPLVPGDLGPEFNTLCRLRLEIYYGCTDTINEVQQGLVALRTNRDLFKHDILSIWSINDIDPGVWFEFFNPYPSSPRPLTKSAYLPICKLKTVNLNLSNLDFHSLIKLIGCFYDPVSQQSSLSRLWLKAVNVNVGIHEYLDAPRTFWCHLEGIRDLRLPISPFNDSKGDSCDIQLDSARISTSERFSFLLDGIDTLDQIDLPPMSFVARKLLRLAGPEANAIFNFRVPNSQDIACHLTRALGKELDLAREEHRIEAKVKSMACHCSMCRRAAGLM